MKKYGLKGLSGAIALIAGCLQLQAYASAGLYAPTFSSVEPSSGPVDDGTTAPNTLGNDIASSSTLNSLSNTEENSAMFDNLFDIAFSLDDYDGDGMSNLEEIKQGSNPSCSDRNPVEMLVSSTSISPGLETMTVPLLTKDSVRIFPNPIIVTQSAATVSYNLILENNEPHPMAYSLATLSGGTLNTHPTFTAEHLIDSSTRPYDVAQDARAIDMDLDGDMDIVSGVDDFIYWYENDGFQHFTPRIIGTGAVVHDIRCGDIDGDGDFDVLAILTGGGYRITLYKNDGNQNFSRDVIYSVSGNYVRQMDLADLDGDEDLDIAATFIKSAYGGPINSLAVLENDGLGNFQYHGIAPGNLTTGRAVSIADITQDGLADIILGSADPDELIWWENTGDFQYVQHSIGNMSHIGGVAAHDVDCDGDIDLLSAVAYPDNVVSWWENDGSYNFSRHDIEQGAINPYAVVAGDMDKDGDVDIASCSRSGVVWFENNGTQSFQKHIISSSMEGLSLVLADINSDHKPDLLSMSVYDSFCAWWENDLDITKPTWLSISPQKGTIASGEQKIITVMIDSTAQSLGTYTSAVDLILASTTRPQVSIPVQLQRIATAAPTALSAVDITDSQFTARWKNNDETTTHYFIDVSESTNFTAMTGVYSNYNLGNATAGLVTGLVDGVTYWYRVRAANQYEQSDSSNIIEVPVSTNTPYCDYEVTNGVASAGSSDVIDLTKFFYGSGMSYEVVSNSNPALVTASISGSELILDYADGVSGTAAITVRVTDLSNGFWVDNTIQVSVVPEPGIGVGSIALNPQNGLFEQIVSVTNNASVPATAVTLTVTNLSVGATLYNATGTDEHGNPEILWIGTLAAGANMNFTLQYYTATRGVTPTATVLASLSLDEPPDGVSGTSLDLSGRYENIGGGSSFLIEFVATPGRTYYIQYTDDLSSPWKTVQPGILAPVNRVQWIDSGPPGTESVPGSSRFYRIIETEQQD